MQADLVLHNGRVYTMDPARPRAQALAIAGNRILAVGSDAELLPLLGPGGRAVDLAGQAAIPGLIDAHIHFGWYSWAIYQGEVELDNVPTKAEAVARVASRAQKLAAGQWIRGAGWNKNIWP
ncbi:MAG: amidohydrolase family protein, partial [Anaerolineae bacterium]